MSNPTSEGSVETIIFLLGEIDRVPDEQERSILRNQVMNYPTEQVTEARRQYTEEQERQRRGFYHRLMMETE